MVPVSLRLKNFLSYGDAGEPLDFTAFHVACLSGGNGQGKSALLDAITWAIWGEARKSSDQRKPDEEILRIGAREMEVDLIFDLDATRYRIVRSYQQSASGKTSKPGLEVQVLDPDTDGYTPLTAESVRATQAVIDARIGIDYETFINSTFLLQGRSDEFTKKKPTERKEILGKILGLGRYDRLSARAGARWSRLREQANRIEGEVERLTAALEPVGEWETEREAVAQALEATNAEIATVTAEQATLNEQIARFDAADREATGHREALAELATRAARLTAERERLSERIAEANELVAQAETIEAAHARYEALRAERRALDDRATLHRGVETQLHAIELDAKNKTAEAEAELVRLRGRIDAADARIAEDAARVESRPDVEARLVTARAAQARAGALEQTRRLREIAEGKRTIGRTELAKEVARLNERRSTLEKAIQDAAAAPPPDAAALSALDARLADARDAVEQRAHIAADGKKVAAGIENLEERRREAQASREKLLGLRERILTAVEDDCPTCGTPLTAEHRATVAAGYDAQIAELDAQIAHLDGRLADGAARRTELRAEYAALDARAGSLPSIQGERAAAVAARAQADEARQRLEAQRTDLADLDARLEADDFAPEHRAQIAQAEDVLAQNTYSPDDHQRATSVAAGLERLERDLVEIDTAAARLDERRTQRAADAEALERRRAELDSGAHLSALTARGDALRTQLATIGYDAAAHERASRELDSLADAPARLARLLEARRSLAEWTERRAETADQLRAAGEANVARQAALDALADALAGRDDALARRAALVEQRATLDRQRAEALARRGGLDERLKAAAADRAALKGHRSELRGVKKDRALYGHLKRAFGRNGIPSLIIEETLPEVEDRANGLLDRLTDGRTRVTLETLKDKKAGGTKETLDIRITDAQGVARAYETYSGGEAFRVNFALRIALSQMLAERSGRRIRTLVIDEGFGTQDEAGLQALIGAIRAIQDDFDKVIVITHLDEIKAAFPVRIEVVKQPVVGSTYEVLGV